ncbi:MAG: NAD(P)/FAD-dependent oxidoreductase [Salinibacter sp.]
MNEFCADVAILGAGFGGTITALMLERMGLRPVVLDRASHPRFAIGESSTPTGNIILRALADRYDRPRLRPLAAHGPWQDAYPNVTGGRKRGFSYFRHRRGEPFTPTPEHANELLVAASSDPYHSDTQWRRADVDAFLADEVRDAGVPLLENTTVTDVTGGDPWTVQAYRAGEDVRCRAGFLVDATGGGQLLPTLGFAESGAALETTSRALYTHLDGLPRWRDRLVDRGARTTDHPYPCDEAVVHHVLDDGWLWEIRFDDGRVSTGLVLDAASAPSPSGTPPREEWRSHLNGYPTLLRRFANADLADPPGRIVRAGRLQRVVDRAAGPGWALLPSTAGFVDPLHSTGIAHTLSGVERLCRLFEHHGSAPPPSALRDYDRSIRHELRFVDELVRLCYDALPSFRAWTASTMLYFAAATTYERRRADANGIPDDPPAFLCADAEGLWTALRRAHQTVPSDDAASSGALDAYDSTVEDAIRPFNEVGLFDAAVPNMHPHTAAPAT